MDIAYIKINMYFCFILISTHVYYLQLVLSIIKYKKCYAPFTKKIV